MKRKLKLLFQKFFRLDQPARKGRGTGLGLFITKHIIEAHHGRIKIESSAGWGTAAIFTLPQWQPTEKQS